MKYNELKLFLENWLDSMPSKPIPLNMKYSYSTDIRKSINSMIQRIETIPTNERNENPICRSNYRHLLEIKTAIDEKKHDISMYGWVQNSSFKYENVD